MPVLMLMPNGIAVDQAGGVSDYTLDWVFDILTQANGAYLKVQDNLVTIETKNPALQELLHDIALDEVPRSWKITQVH